MFYRSEKVKNSGRKIKISRGKKMPKVSCNGKCLMVLKEKLRYNKYIDREPKKKKDKQKPYHE